MSTTVLSSVFAQGGRTSRYGEFTVVRMHGSSFITTPMEFMQMQNWARGRQSSGNATRDRTSFSDRFETLLARVGSGLATRGNRSSLSRIVKAMTANAVLLEEWSIPRDLNEGVEIKKKPGQPVVGKIPLGGTFAAANEPLPGSVTPLVQK